MGELFVGVMWRCALLLVMWLGAGAGVMALAESARDLPAELGLDADATTRFWPVYSEYRYEVAKLRDERRRLLDDVRPRAATLDVGQAEEFVDRWLDNQRGEVKLLERFVKRLGRVLTEPQLARLLLIELAAREGRSGGLEQAEQTKQAEQEKTQ